MASEGRVAVGRLCTRCLSCTEGHEDSALYDLAHIDDKTISNLMNESRHSVRGLNEKAWQCAQERLEETEGAKEQKRGQLRDLKERFSQKLLEELAAGGDLDRILEEYLGDDQRKQLEQDLANLEHREEIGPEDLRTSLRDLVDRELIEINGESIRITPKGSRRLARYILNKLWANVSPARSGFSQTKDEGFGVSDGFATKRYEHGDEFHRIDMEATLLSALGRKGNGSGTIEFDEEDLRVRETIEDTRLSIGLIVDESGSMSGEKIHAAMDISLALSEMIRRNPGDRLRLFFFSNEVRELAYWDMLNTTFSGGTTDIRSALRRFRLSTTADRADKQVYLITDSEPNSEDGKYIGFEKAALGVIQEATLFQKERITLNVVMLDATPHLAEFASFLAMRNLGRVFFAAPHDLGRVVMEDYLRTRRKGRPARSA